jgi:hypothetical protein
MVRLQIINLLAPEQRPELLAEVLDHIECVSRTRAIAGEALNEAEADAVTEREQPVVDSLEGFGRVGSGCHRERRTGGREGAGGEALGERHDLDEEEVVGGEGAVGGCRIGRGVRRERRGVERHCCRDGGNNGG